jgi:hypothetical protein
VPSESDSDPADSLADIIENAQRIETYLANMGRHAFERDGKTRTLLNAVWNVSARLHTDWVDAQWSLCPTNLGQISAVWATGCDTPTTAWTWISSGTLRETICPASRQTRDGPSLI